MRWNRIIALGLAAGGIVLRAQDPYPVTFEPGVEMKTRDGVVLRADIYRPNAPGKFPVLINRTPYNKYIYLGDGLRSAARGYVFIIQDERGRYTSDGDWYPFRDDGKDGYDAVEWAAGLPYSNGKVGLVGISYVGVTVMQAAAEAPPHLVAIYPGVTGSDYHANWAYQGGALSLGFSQGWTASMVVNELTRRASRTLPAEGYFDQRKMPADFLPLDPGRPETLGGFFRDWIAHPAYDDYWRSFSLEERYNRIRVPALHFGAWYDLFLGGSLKNYTGLRDHAATDEARKGQRLIVIPGGHAGFGRKIGDVDFGPEAAFDFNEVGLRWFDWVLKGVDNGMAREKPVRIFVMGRNVWRDEDEWPLARAVETRYYLQSAGSANSLAGDGTLSTGLPVEEPADRFVSDPDNPVPSHGGVMPCKDGVGPIDQRTIEARRDVLVYTSAPVATDTEVTGPVRLELYVSSSAVDTDFTGKLVDVGPDGRALILTEGILRARYRNSMEKAEFMIPGHVYPVTADLWATSNVFLAGHRLRVEVAGSCYPRFDLNPNTDESPESSRARVAATNVIYHDRAHPSCLVVPLIP